MELPDHIFDALRACSPTARWVALCLVRYGRPVVDHTTGGRRVYVKVSTAGLARLAGASKRSVIDAVHELAEAELITVHEATRANASRGLSMALDAPGGGAKLAPPVEPGSPAHGGGDRSPIRPSGDVITTTTTTPSRAREAAQKLHRLGVNGAEGWVESVGVEVAEEVGDYVEELGAAARNPGGLAVALMRSGFRRGRRPAGAGAVAVESGGEALVARVARYQGAEAAEAARERLMAGRSDPSGGIRR